ncbi:hypothetical protein AGMMS49953_06750 [Endomicrobiia bacterium]|nr:hypothetical protein AGMMS49953_06750 [Endomicrobiia bacterium]
MVASLLEAADKIANTASIYGAFLKSIKQSLKDIVLEPAFFEVNNNRHKVYNKDSNKLIKEISGDILYLDPPYNTRQFRYIFLSYNNEGLMNIKEIKVISETKISKV